MLAVLAVNTTNLIVIAVLSILILLVVIHLVRVYKKSPCGDCAHAKQCQAFDKKKIIKAFKKQCKLEERSS